MNAIETACVVIGGIYLAVFAAVAALVIVTALRHKRTIRRQAEQALAFARDLAERDPLPTLDDELAAMVAEYRSGEGSA